MFCKYGVSWQNLTSSVATNSEHCILVLLNNAMVYPSPLTFFFASGASLVGASFPWCFIQKCNEALILCICGEKHASSGRSIAYGKDMGAFLHKNILMSWCSKKIKTAWGDGPHGKNTGSFLVWKLPAASMPVLNMGLLQNTEEKFSMRNHPQFSKRMSWKMAWKPLAARQEIEPMRCLLQK